MAQHPQIDLQVAYCCLRGTHSGFDTDFATAIQWDVPLLDGYNWVKIPNVGTGDESFLGLCNPGLWRLIRRGSFDAVICHTGYLKASFWIAFLAARLSGSVLENHFEESFMAPTLLFSGSNHCAFFKNPRSHAVTRLC